MTQIVTRFAPSPTGFLHIGGARTALFAWLLAKSAGGTFLLRIEDTDRERSTQPAIDAIIEAMAWLGLTPDAETVFQSKNADRHNQVIDELMAKGKAYWCECTKERLDQVREAAMAAGRKPKYDGCCRGKNLGPGEGRVVRLAAPLSGSCAFDDMVKGPIAVANEELDDLILRRSDGTPTYNLAVVVDDHDMGVTHVLRGDDHVNNTPRQIHIYEAMGWDIPRFGHVPMILGPDKKKLSKRHGALSVMEYETMGYLPEAMVNYLARLGWSHGDQEVFSREELIQSFSTDNLGSSPSVFDTQKLEWLNAHYIKEADVRRLRELLMAVLRREMGAEADQVEAAYLEEMLPLLQPRAKTLRELAEATRIFLADAAYLMYDEKAVKKFITDQTRPLLEVLETRLAALDDYSDEGIETVLRGFIEERDLKFKDIAQPLRVALTGTTQSPGIFETIRVLGKKRTLARMARALEL